MEERRVDHRYSVNGKAIAIFKPRPILMGQVVDISMVGLSVHYHHSSRLGDVHTHLVVELIGADGTRVEPVPFRIMSDMAISPGFASDGKPLRRAGLKFGNLTRKQQSKIRALVDGCRESCRLEMAYYNMALPA
jgi:hypothetical protein